MKNAKCLNPFDSTCKFEVLEDRRLMSAGAGGGVLDPSFGIGGKLMSADIGFSPVKFAVQSDGKIIAVGNPFGQSFSVARLHSDGSLDKTFGPQHDGKAAIHLGAAAEEDQVSAIAIQPDGKIVVAGSTLAQNKVTKRYDYDQMAVARFTASGTPDSSFGQSGATTAGFDQGQSNGSAMALQRDGKIVVAGHMYDGGFFNADYDDFAAIRFNANGTVDTSFGNNGRRHQDFDGNEYGSAIAIDYTGTAASNPRYGTIVIGGTGYNDDGSYLAFTRLQSNGAPDTRFGGNDDARIKISARSGATINDLTILADGRVAAAGTDGLNSIMVTRLLANGSTDNTFGNKGIVTTDLVGKDEAETIRFTADNQFLVGGYAHGDFSLTRYNSNGTADKAFGISGTAETDFGGDEGIRAVNVTADGRILTIGRQEGSHQVLMARYFQATPTVRVSATGADTYEGAPANSSAVVFTRDAAYSFPTTVFYQTSGTATAGADYTGPFVPQTIIGPGGFPVVISAFRRSVVIPAFQTSVSVPVNIVDDHVLEPAETLTVTAQPDASYVLGQKQPISRAAMTRAVTSTGGAIVPALDNSATISIADNDSIHINFQSASNTAAGDYLADTGAVFGDRGNGLIYGWDKDNSANAHIRGSSGSPDLRYDSVAVMQPSGKSRHWDIAIPNGMYEVRLVAGDPTATNSVYKMNVEGQRVLTGTPSGDTRWFRSTAIVNVTDGSLTLSNGVGAQNNKIDFIDIQGAPAGATLGPVTGATDLPVQLFSPATANQWHKNSDGLFSDQQFDDTSIWDLIGPHRTI